MGLPLPQVPLWSRVAPPGSIRYRFAQPLSLVFRPVRTSLTVCPNFPLKVILAVWPAFVTRSGTAGPLTVTVPLELTVTPVTAAAAWLAHPGSRPSSARAAHPAAAPASRPVIRAANLAGQALRVRPAGE